MVASQAQLAQLRQLQSMANPMANGLMLPRSPSTSQVNPALAQQIENLLNPEVWTMFDTAIISPSTAAGSPTIAFANFANVTGNIPFFNARTAANSSYAISSMTTVSGYVDLPYKAYGVGVEVWCDTDAPSGAAQFTARQFVESVVYGGALTLQFATDYKLIIPISDLPAGGGVAYGFATDTRAAAVNQTAGGGTNGTPAVSSRTLWKDYILFRDKQPFNVSVVLNPVSLARINALTALTGNFSAGIKVKFWGYRGKQLVLGGPLRG